MATLKKFFIPQEEKVHEVTDDDLPTAPKKVLMLDDDVGLTVILREFLEANAFQVTVVATGVDGIKCVMAGDFDVILCDMMMPKMPGDMFYLAVERARPHLCKRFIFMTGHKGNPKIDNFIRQVKGLMLWKPFEMHTLLDAIHVILKKSHSGGAK